MPAALVWFRRDLRVHDHAALHHALKTQAIADKSASFNTQARRMPPD